MIKLTQRLETPINADATATLSLDQRVKGRLRIRLDDDRDAGLFLDRGPILRNGDCLATDDGYVVKVKAAPEVVSCVRCDDPHLMARVCYHLGNRHTPLEIQAGLIRYQHDHVLDDMVRGLGLEPTVEQAPFEPEPGAYGEHGSDHAHGHSHSHSHSHGHAHAH